MPRKVIANCGAMPGTAPFRLKSCCGWARLAAREARRQDWVRPRMAARTFPALRG